MVAATHVDVRTPQADSSSQHSKHRAALVSRLRRISAGRPWVVWLAVLVFFGILGGALNLHFITTNPHLSPFDEYVYLDAVDKAGRGIVVRDGMTTDSYAREVLACLGFGSNPVSSATIGVCGGDFPEDKLPFAGYTTAGVHSPVYYFLTAWLAKPFMMLGMGLLGSARLTSVLWLVLGMTVLAWGMRRIGATWAMALTVPLLITSMPTFRTTNCYITPDALNLLVGTLIIFGSIFYARRQWSLGWLLLIAAVACVVKMQNIFAVVAVLIFLVWYRIRPGHGWGKKAAADPASLPRWWEIGALGSVSAVAGGAWLVIRPFITVARPDIVVDPTGVLDVRQLPYMTDDALQIIFAGIGGTAQQYPKSPFASLALWLGITAIVCVAWILERHSTLEQRFSQAAAVSFLGIAPGVVLGFNILSGSLTLMQHRYGMVLIPLFCAAAAWIKLRHSVAWGLALLTACMYGYALIIPSAT
ncbi:glycosyltransferase family 39 protein [Actinotignum sp. GS-2025f]|uniref:glycosyltransferase family 39 protein n=1 Tax=unclassified Actinotignum TaxID=2632702 RepID=UPI002A8245C8|nr:hypothetical protein [Actinotignum sp. SLA_B059]MDY5127593.1 hypothetical protein [Actinotignum sp. SLA_B059]